MPAPTITTALENSLDMCFSALYMHELHRKYHHGDYIDLDNVKEENDEQLNEENDYQENSYDLNLNRPLLSKSVKYQSNISEQESDSDHNATITNLNANTPINTNRTKTYDFKTPSSIV